jgi:hypothetical protein
MTYNADSCYQVAIKSTGIILYQIRIGYGVVVNGSPELRYVTVKTCVKIQDAPMVITIMLRSQGSSYFGR